MRRLRARADAKAAAEAGEEVPAALVVKRKMPWYAPVVPVATLGALIAFAYMAVDTFSRDFRLIMNAMKSEDVSTLRQVLYGFGPWQAVWGYFATVVRMLTAPWSLGALTEALVGRLGPGMGWTMLIAGVVTGVAIWGAIVWTVVLGVRAFLRTRRKPA
jgi:hypothetical protein